MYLHTVCTISEVPAGDVGVTGIVTTRKMYVCMYIQYSTSILYGAVITWNLGFEF